MHLTATTCRIDSIERIIADVGKVMRLWEIGCGLQRRVASFLSLKSARAEHESKGQLLGENHATQEEDSD